MRSLFDEFSPNKNHFSSHIFPRRSPSVRLAVPHRPFGKPSRSPPLPPSVGPGNLVQGFFVLLNESSMFIVVIMIIITILIIIHHEYLNIMKLYNK